MKVILKPVVTVVGITQFIEHPIYKIPSDGTDAEKLGAFAAKGCYDSYNSTGRANTLNQAEVIGHRHGSVIEHAHATVFIEGITRALSLELNRHRPFGISQRSTRYTKEEDAAVVLEPFYAELFRKYDPQWSEGGKTWYTTHPDPERFDHREFQLLLGHLDFVNLAFVRYRTEVEALIELNPQQLEGFDLRKWARGKARNVLPHGLETRGTYTGNYRAWRWFIEARSERHAEPEIRRLSDTVLKAISPLAPIYFEDFEQISEYDNIPEWQAKNRKV